MTDIARILKAEIARLARKEAKKYALPLRKRLSGISRTVTEQKRALADLGKRVDLLKKMIEETRPEPVRAAPAKVKKSRVSPRLIKSQRKRLGLNQENFARLLGVSVATIRSWEQGRSSPGGRNLAVFVGIRRLRKTEAYNRLGIRPKRKKSRRRSSRPRRQKQQK